MSEETPRYPVTPQHPPRLVRVRLQWNGRLFEAARVPHGRGRIAWMVRRNDGSKRYLPPKHAQQQGPHAWPPEPEWWQPLQPDKWDAPLPPPLPLLPSGRRHDGLMRMVNIRARPRRRVRAQADDLAADDKPWWWDATAIRYEPRGSITPEMAEGRLMRALTVSGAGVLREAVPIVAAATFRDLAAAARAAEAEARIATPPKERIAHGPADREDWLNAMGWFAELNPPSYAVAHDLQRQGATRDLSDRQMLLVWRAHQRSWRAIGEELGRPASTVRDTFIRMIARVVEIANAPPGESMLARHIELVQARNRSYKRRESVL